MTTLPLNGISYGKIWFLYIKLTKFYIDFLSPSSLVQKRKVRNAYFQIVQVICNFKLLGENKNNHQIGSHLGSISLNLLKFPEFFFRNKNTRNKIPFKIFL